MHQKYYDKLTVELALKGLCVSVSSSGDKYYAYLKDLSDKAKFIVYDDTTITFYIKCSPKQNDEENRKIAERKLLRLYDETRNVVKKRQFL